MKMSFVFLGQCLVFLLVGTPLRLVLAEQLVGGGIPPNLGASQAPLCQGTRKLNFTAEECPPVSGAGTIWGGNPINCKGEFDKRLEEVKSKGGQTFCYFEGPCGKTNGAWKGGELERCSQIAQQSGMSYEQWKCSGKWMEHTFNELKQHPKCDFFEIDNVDGYLECDNAGDKKANFGQFLDKVNNQLVNMQGPVVNGQVQKPKLVLKNVGSDLAGAVSDKNKHAIAEWSIFETKSRGSADLTAAQNALKQKKINTLGSYDSDKYGTDMDKDVNCPGGT